jgi:sugar diacid utilization regulator
MNFLARTTLGHYNHFRAVENQSEVARILGIHRNTLYLRVERARRILRSNLDGVELVGMNQAGRDSNQSVFID